jgi:hypothetical protein
VDCSQLLNDIGIVSDAVFQEHADKINQIKPKVIILISLFKQVNLIIFKINLFCIVSWGKYQKIHAVVHPIKRESLTPLMTVQD